MPRRAPNDGGHTAFTDHRIRRRPEPEAQLDAAGTPSPPLAIAPWREPPEHLAKRNLGMASIQVGLEKMSPQLIVSGYRMLTEVQQQFPQDSELFTTLGSALFAGRQYGEAVQAYDLAVRFDPRSSPKEENLGLAFLALAQPVLAQQHLEKAMQIDPLNLSAAATLMNLYKQAGEQAKADELSKQLEQLIQQDMRVK
jgi:tetratricopeptide (TPR) repeat protein